nr:retrovirus-related Pol polyprotein from transposon TNT 1-94 [Tanacetum cinerariifolium]
GGIGANTRTCDFKVIPLPGLNSKQWETLLQMLKNGSGFIVKMNGKYLWIIDSGASHHMTVALRYMKSPLHKIWGNEIVNEDTPVHDDQTVRDDDTFPSPQSLSVEEQIQEENLGRGYRKKETSVRLHDYVTNTVKKKSPSYFTPPARSQSSVAASKQWELHQMDVHNAFLHGCPLTRLSLIGWLVYLGDSPVSWKTKKQHIVSRSSDEAEYRSMALTNGELKWLKGILKILEYSDVNESIEVVSGLVEEVVVETVKEPYEVENRLIVDQDVVKERSTTNLSTKGNPFMADGKVGSTINKVFVKHHEELIVVFGEICKEYVGVKESQTNNSKESAIPLLEEMKLRDYVCDDGIEVDWELDLLV